MAYTQNEKSTGLDVLTDVTLTQSDLHIVGDVSDSGRAKAITQDLLEDYIANSPNFISELTSNATFISDINTIAPSPLTTKGDLFTYSTLADRLPVGTDGQVLSADSAETTGLKWIDLVAGGGGGTKLAINTTAFSHTGDTTETTMFTVSIPGGTLGTNDAIRFYILGHADGDSNNVTFRTKYGASTVATVVDSSGSDDDYIYSGMIIADNLTNAQVSSNQFVKSGNITGASDGTDSAVDSTADQNLVITMQLASAGGTVTAKGIIVEKISGSSTTAVEQNLGGIGPSYNSNPTDTELTAITAETDGSVLYASFKEDNDNPVIVRYEKDTNTGFYKKTHILEISVTGTGSSSLAVIGSYLYVYTTAGANAVDIKRLLSADLSGATSMTETPSVTGGDNGAMFTDGTDLFINVNTAVGTWKQYSISGTALTYVQDITSGMTGVTNAFYIGGLVYMLDSTDITNTINAYSYTTTFSLVASDTFGMGNMGQESSNPDSTLRGIVPIGATTFYVGFAAVFRGYFGSTGSTSGCQNLIIKPFTIPV